MALSEVGVSRQEAHEEIRVLSHQAAVAVKMEGKENDLVDRIRRMEPFKPIIGRLDELLEPKNSRGVGANLRARWRRWRCREAGGNGGCACFVEAVSS